MFFNFVFMMVETADLVYLFTAEDVNLLIHKIYKVAISTHR